MPRRRKHTVHRSGSIPVWCLIASIGGLEYVFLNALHGTPAIERVVDLSTHCLAFQWAKSIIFIRKKFSKFRSVYMEKIYNKITTYF